MKKKCLCITIPLSLLLHNNIHNHIHNMYVCMYIYIFFLCMYAMNSVDIDIYMCIYTMVPRTGKLVKITNPMPGAFQVKDGGFPREQCPKSSWKSKNIWLSGTK